jgi:hypothetical protein
MPRSPDLNELIWRQLLTRYQPETLTVISAGFACKSYQRPFGGAGSKVTGLLGFRPPTANPDLCNI